LRMRGLNFQRQARLGVYIDLEDSEKGTVMGGLKRTQPQFLVRWRIFLLRIYLQILRGRVESARGHGGSWLFGY